MPITDEKINQEILEAIRLGHGFEDIATLTGLTAGAVRQRVYRMAEHGLLERIGTGKFRVLIPSDFTNGAAGGVYADDVPYTPASVPVESFKRRVEIPTFMREKTPVTVSVERSIDIIHDVVKLDVCVTGAWIPIAFKANVRICIGDERPEWSDSQVTYDNVVAYRVTTQNGDQFDMAHDPSKPFTIDLQ